jgi:hypothetical protein
MNIFTSAHSLWWLALAGLLWPIWLHRQKRQRLQAETLAVARFLPAVAPQQHRVWRWIEWILLALRCLLLAGLVAWLADGMVAWRGDTVWVGEGVDPAWAAAQISQAGMATAHRASFCAQQQSGQTTDCPELFSWLQLHERAFRPDARLLVLANGGQLAMPATLPTMQHALDLRIKPAPVTAITPVQHHIVVASALRLAQWQAMFSAFESAGNGVDKYLLDVVPTAQTELIVWDNVDASPPLTWKAPLWWIADSPAMAELAAAPSVTVNGLTLRYADSARGRLWSSTQWPATDVTGLRAIYEGWQLLAHPAVPYSLASQAIKAALAHPMVLPGAGLQELLGWLLLVLFALERILSHARKS